MTKTINISNLKKRVLSSVLYMFICISAINTFAAVDESSDISSAECVDTEITKCNCAIDYDAIVKAINHRGYSVVAPENTLSAYKLSKLKGFKYVECDVAFTFDGIPVLLHDTTIDRTSNGTGNISDMTFEEVRTYDFGSWKNTCYADEKIPSFKEFIQLCRNIGLYPYIELKDVVSAEQCQILIDIVNGNGMKGKVTWISFNTHSLTNIKNIDASARLGYLIKVSTSESPYIIPNALLLKTDTNEVFIGWDVSKLTDDAVELCIQNSIPIEAWTVNTENEILSLNTYITGVTSDSIIAGKVLYEANYCESNDLDSEKETGSTENGQSVTETTAKAVEGNLVFDTKITDAADTNMLHIALYDAANSLCGYIIIPNERALKDVFTVFADDGKAATAKVFVWNEANKITPAAKSETVQIVRE